MDQDILVTIAIVTIVICFTICNVHSNNCQLKLMIAKLKKENDDAD